MFSIGFLLTCAEPSSAAVDSWHHVEVGIRRQPKDGEELGHSQQLEALTPLSFSIHHWGI